MLITTRESKESWEVALVVLIASLGTDRFSLQFSAVLDALAVQPPCLLLFGSRGTRDEVSSGGDVNHLRRLGPSRGNLLSFAAAAGHQCTRQFAPILNP
jgi:hypothetical protein